MRLSDLKYVFKPRFWLMNNPYSHSWDKHLNEFMDSGQKISRRCNYLVSINNVHVWISNYPYAFARPFIPYKIDIRPSRRTIERFRNFIDDPNNYEKYEGLIKK